MRVCNPDCPPLTINGRNTAPTPTGFAEIVGDDLPLFHAECWLLVIDNRLQRGFVQFYLCAHFLGRTGLINKATKTLPLLSDASPRGLSICVAICSLSRQAGITICPRKEIIEAITSQSATAAVLE
jgi:hypothetical protein